MQVLRRGATSAAIFGLTLVLSGTAAAAGPARPAPAGACAIDRAVNAADVIRRATACSYQGGRPEAVPATAQAAATAVRQAVQARPQVCGPPFVKQDPRLGPVFLPRTGFIGFVLRGYVRYGGLRPLPFLYQYWDVTKVPNDWRFPPDDGFIHELPFINSHPVRFPVTLRVGQLIDRFGSEFGQFLSPAGASFGSRALPPDRLNTNPTDPAHLCNYHIYRVIRKFTVDAGPAQPAFQMPGLGLQYVLVSAYIPGAPNPLGPKWLVDNGYLQRVY